MREKKKGIAKSEKKKAVQKNKTKNYEWLH